MERKALAGKEVAIVPIAAVTVSLGTLQATNPRALVDGAAAIAGVLAEVIKSQRLSVAIQGKQYVRVEGWTTLAVMLGVVAREVSTVEEFGVYTATAELVRISDGAVISRASAECGEESPWCDRPRFARRSMAQTRSVGKACRLAFSWIMSLAGYETCPAEEMQAAAKDDVRRAKTAVEMSCDTEGPRDPAAVDKAGIRMMELLAAQDAAGLSAYSRTLDTGIQLAVWNKLDSKQRRRIKELISVARTNAGGNHTTDHGGQS